MRLRSHQFVFLFLLACCVQFGDDCASRMLQGEIYGNAAVAFAAREAVRPASQPASRFSSLHQLPSATMKLDSASAASHRVIWTMPHPASASAAVASFTGLLRA